MFRLTAPKRWPMPLDSPSNIFLPTSCPGIKTQVVGTQKPNVEMVANWKISSLIQIQLSYLKGRPEGQDLKKRCLQNAVRMISGGSGGATSSDSSSRTFQAQAFTSAEMARASQRFQDQVVRLNWDRYDARLEAVDCRMRVILEEPLELLGGTTEGGSTTSPLRYNVSRNWGDGAQLSPKRKGDVSAHVYFVSDWDVSTTIATQRNGEAAASNDESFTLSGSSIFEVLKKLDGEIHEHLRIRESNEIRNITHSLSQDLNCLSRREDLVFSDLGFSPPAGQWAVKNCFHRSLPPKNSVRNHNRKGNGGASLQRHFEVQVIDGFENQRTWVKNHPGADRHSTPGIVNFMAKVVKTLSPAACVQKPMVRRLVDALQKIEAEEEEAEAEAGSQNTISINSKVCNLLVEEVRESSFTPEGRTKFVASWMLSRYDPVLKEVALHALSSARDFSKVEAIRRCCFQRVMLFNNGVQRLLDGSGGPLVVLPFVSEFDRTSAEKRFFKKALEETWGQEELFEERVVQPKDLYREFPTDALSWRYTRALALGYPVPPLALVSRTSSSMQPAESTHSPRRLSLYKPRNEDGVEKTPRRSISYSVSSQMVLHQGAPLGSSEELTGNDLVDLPILLRKRDPNFRWSLQPQNSQSNSHHVSYSASIYQGLDSRRRNNGPVKVGAPLQALREVLWHAADERAQSRIGSVFNPNDLPPQFHFQREMLNRAITPLIGTPRWAPTSREETLKNSLFKFLCACLYPIQVEIEVAQEEGTQHQLLTLRRHVTLITGAELDDEKLNSTSSTGLSTDAIDGAADSSSSSISESGDDLGSYEELATPIPKSCSINLTSHGFEGVVLAQSHHPSSTEAAVMSAIIAALERNLPSQARNLRSVATFHCFLKNSAVRNVLFNKRFSDGKVAGFPALEIAGHEDTAEFQVTLGQRNRASRGRGFFHVLHSARNPLISDALANCVKQAEEFICRSRPDLKTFLVDVDDLKQTIISSENNRKTGTRSASSTAGAKRGSTTSLEKSVLFLGEPRSSSSFSQPGEENWDYLTELLRLLVRHHRYPPLRSASLEVSEKATIGSATNNKERYIDLVATVATNSTEGQQSPQTEEIFRRRCVALLSNPFGEDDHCCYRNSSGTIAHNPEDVVSDVGGLLPSLEDLLLSGGGTHEVKDDLSKLKQVLKSRMTGLETDTALLNRYTGYCAGLHGHQKKVHLLSAALVGIPGAEVTLNTREIMRRGSGETSSDETAAAAALLLIPSGIFQYSQVGVLTLPVNVREIQEEHKKSDSSCHWTQDSNGNDHRTSRTTALFGERSPVVSTRSSSSWNQQRGGRTDRKRTAGRKVKVVLISGTSPGKKVSEDFAAFISWNQLLGPHLGFGGGAGGGIINDIPSHVPSLSTKAVSTLMSNNTNSADITWSTGTAKLPPMRIETALSKKVQSTSSTANVMRELKSIFQCEQALSRVSTVIQQANNHTRAAVGTTSSGRRRNSKGVLHSLQVLTAALALDQSEWEEILSVVEVENRGSGGGFSLCLDDLLVDATTTTIDWELSSVWISVNGKQLEGSSFTSLRDKKTGGLAPGGRASVAPAILHAYVRGLIRGLMMMGPGGKHARTNQSPFSEWNKLLPLYDSNLHWAQLMQHEVTSKEQLAVVVGQRYFGGPFTLLRHQFQETKDTKAFWSASLLLPGELDRSSQPGGSEQLQDRHQDLSSIASILQHNGMVPGHCPLAVTQDPKKKTADKLAYQQGLDTFVPALSHRHDSKKGLMDDFSWLSPSSLQ